MKSESELKPLREELKVLNEKFFAAMAERKAWMDAHMADFARYQVGDAIFEFSTGKRLGVISKLYRYWGADNRDPQYDHTMNIEYEYHTGNNCYDNTSRRPIHIATKQELLDYQKLRSEIQSKDWSGIFCKPSLTDSGANPTKAPS